MTNGEKITVTNGVLNVPDQSQLFLILSVTVQVLIFGMQLHGY